MGKILIVGANGAVGQSCISKLANKDLVLISRSEFNDNSDKGSQIGIFQLNRSSISPLRIPSNSRNNQGTICHPSGSLSS